MRVLHVIPTLATRTGGPPAAVVAACLALRDCGVDTTIVATDMAEAASATQHARVAIADLPAGAGSLDVRLFPAVAPRRLAFSPALYESVHAIAGEYDVVHVHSLFLFPQFAAYRGAFGRKVPYVVSPRGSLDPHLRMRGRAVKAMSDALWQRRFLERAAAIHVTSDEEARLIADVATSVPRRVIPNGVDVSAYRDLPSGVAFKQRWFGGDAQVVLYHGRLSHKKGLDVLIDAFARVAQSHASARLAIVGPDDEGMMPQLRALTATLGIADRVGFTGMLQGDLRLEALAAADAWALPSQTENFGNAVVEAMAAGVSVVISPQVNIAPEIAAAGAGIVAERSAAAFAREIASLLDDEPARRTLGARGREFASQYDWSLVGPRMAAMYGEILRRN